MASSWLTMVVLAVSAILLSCQARPAVAQQKGESAGASAESQGWELLLHDTFDRPDLGDQWQIIEGQWEIQDGHLCGSGTLISSQGFPKQAPAGYQRLELEAISDIKPLMLIPGVKPKVVASDMDPFIHAEPFEAGGKNTSMTGYFFQFGGGYNTVNRVRHQSSILWEDKEPKATIDTEKWHRVVVENDRGTLRFFVDGNLLYKGKLASITMGIGHDRVGFHFLTKVKVREVKVFIKKLPNDLDVE